MPSLARARASCLWCGRDVADGTVGRRRKYCKQSCRQRAYEQRQLTAGSSIADDSTILSKLEAEDLVERLFVLRCSAEDLATAIDEAASLNELATLSKELVLLAKDAERLR